MNPEELASRIRDLVARLDVMQQQLQAARAHNDYLRLQLRNRPSKADYQKLAAELQRTRVEHRHYVEALEAELRRSRVRTY